MTYKEAEDFKNSQPLTFNENGLLFTVYVVPKDGEDFTRFCGELRLYKQVEEGFAKLFSKDEQFSVTGICLQRDTNNLYHRLLK